MVGEEDKEDEVVVDDEMSDERRKETLDREEAVLLQSMAI